ncbi:hypothetical protein Drorol1_Dr00014956 [Drosera rotundifolia]
MAEDQYSQARSSSGGGWWDSSRARFETTSSSSTAPSSSGLTVAGGGGGSYGSWLTETVDIGMRSVSINSPASEGASGATTAATMLVDPNLQIMGLALASPNLDWNHSLMRNEKAGEESSFRSMLQEGMGTTPTNFNNEASASGGMFGSQIHHQWRTTEKLYPDEGSSEFKQINHMESGHFNPLDSSSLYSSPASILQGLMIPDQQQQQSSSAFESRQIEYGYGHHQHPSYGLAAPNDSSLVPSWIKTPQFITTASSAPKQVSAQQHAPLQFTNNAPYWNASVAAMGMATDVGRPSFFPTLQPSQLPMTVPTFSERAKQNAMEARGETLKKSSSDQATNKRPRNEASPTLPPFKVRKEKMGDRITALQQLVSPFGKTDTASVLSEAIEYIKFLHQQVNVLSTPYLKSGASLQHHQNNEKTKDQDGPKQDLRSRGLCLVPVSSTFPVAHETTVDFWTPTFGGTFR